MSTAFAVIFFSLVGGVFSVMVAALFLVLGERRRTAWLPDLVGFAIGALLATAFAAILPHAAELHGGDLHQLGLTMLAGILVFFLLEKVLLWRHSHTGHGEDHDHCRHETRQAARPWLVLFGDATHNLVDGVLIGVAFSVDLHLGIITALAVATHEIPQELGDFAVLLHSGMSPGRAIAFNLLASTATVVGALIGYWALNPGWLPFALAFAAASFIYVAMADLIPGLQHTTTGLDTLRQCAMIVLGAVAILAAHAGMHGG